MPNSAYEYSVRITVYGVKSEGDCVGQLLSDAGLYLQHPSAAELYRHLEYRNPHYLLCPGSQIPKLEALSISPEASSVAATDSMDEAHKTRFMQIFNSAKEPNAPLKSTPSPRLKSRLKEYRHKVTGTCQSSPIPVYGGILADEMGLGKSLSLLALVCSSLDSLANQERSPNDGISRATLIVTPKSTIPGWKQQVQRHIHADQLRLAVYHGSNRNLLPSMFWENDIILTTYETLRLEWAANGPLYSGIWRRVVLDEAHHIRNRSSKLFKAALAVASKSRWCLTGTPIHNSLDDYGALLTFIGVPLLMEKSQFDFWIMSPIKKKQPNCFNILGDLIRATCLRRTKDIMQNLLMLPERTEKIEEIELHQADQNL
ncbi:SNF2 family N-terminal domain-containing protein [Bisporella sp. PMI_857]|nr:SNF2 family N-terminal domain-containing protein [Bisporella sp. PMI_857]